MTKPFTKTESLVTKLTSTVVLGTACASTFFKWTKSMVVFSKNPIHSVLYLVLTFFSIAGQYLLLNAQFLAVVHIVVYSGAIMVLFLFVLMLLNLNTDSEPQKSSWIKFAA